MQENRQEVSPYSQKADVDVRLATELANKLATGVATVVEVKDMYPYIN